MHEGQYVWGVAYIDGLVDIKWVVNMNGVVRWGYAWGTGNGRYGNFFKNGSRTTKRME